VAKRTYTDADRAAVVLALQVNQGNVARTARDTGVSESTVRDWKRVWDKDGPPENVQAEAVEQAKEFVAELEEVRNKTLSLLRDKLDEVRPDKLATVFGILDDKYRLAIGLATSRSETVHALPSPEEAGELFVGMIQKALEAQKQRSYDVEVEVEQADQKALGPAR
jgi:transposase-like protein